MLRCDFIPLGSPFGMLVECWPFKISILNPLGNATGILTFQNLHFEPSWECTFGMLLVRCWNA